MIKKTNNYDLFIFRKDNRQKIDSAHVQRLVASIQSRNLLELRPITVNEKMEVIDGQHRLLAAKQLGTDIYYEIEQNLEATDIIRMNISKQWGEADYINFYCQHGFEEYIKLRDFMVKNNLTLKVALRLSIGNVKISRTEFRMGLYKFNGNIATDEINLCWDTLNLIKKFNGYCSWTHSSKFWNALLKLIRHPAFEQEKWFSNAEKMIDNFGARPSEKNYVQMIAKIYNFQSRNRIDLGEDEYK